MPDRFGAYVLCDSYGFGFVLVFCFWKLLRRRRTSCRSPLKSTSFGFGYSSDPVDGFDRHETTRWFISNRRRKNVGRLSERSSRSTTSFEHVALSLRALIWCARARVQPLLQSEVLPRPEVSIFNPCNSNYNIFLTRVLRYALLRLIIAAS